MSEKSRTQFLARRRLLAVAIAGCFANGPAWANPNGAQVANGTASFSQAGKLLTVTNTPGSIINWNSFSIGAGETTRFQQASAASSVLNRVLANDPSVLLGTLSSNGKVWLVNPAGIMVGQGAKIDVGGFVASTLNVRNEDFLAGRLNFQATPNAGKVENYGQITAPSGGSVYLIGSAVTNNGIINASNGDVILAAGQTVSLVDTGTPGVKVDITGAEGNVTNLGQIAAEAGRIGMAGVLVRNSGELNASSVVKEGGRVFLKASQDAYVDGAGRIVTTGTKGGSIEVLGNRVAVMDQAQLDASGSSGGGTVLVGGDYQGKNAAVQNANITFFGPQASIKADATDKGDGGKVIVWADDTTRAYGNISARGGQQSGNGGFVETSGHRYLDVSAIRVNTSASNGASGNWLLDPTDVTIYGGTGSPPGTFTNGIFNNGGGASATVYAADINYTLQYGGNVTIMTSSGGGGSGDITFSGTADTSTGGAVSIINNATVARTFTLQADRDIALHDGAQILGANASNALSLAMLAKRDILLGQSGINLYGGSLTLTAGWNGNTATPTGLAANAPSGGYGGSIFLNGTGITNTSGVDVNALAALNMTSTPGVSGSAAGFSAPNGGTMNISVHDLTMTAADGHGAFIGLGAAGTQTINVVNALTLNGASAAATGLGDPHISAGSTTSTASQTINAGQIALNAGYGGNATIELLGGGTQTLTVTGALTLTAAASSATPGSSGQAIINSSYLGAPLPASQTINAGQIILTGGALSQVPTTAAANGWGNWAQISSAGTQTVSANSVTLTGGASGQNNWASIDSWGTQKISAGTLNLNSGGSSSTASTDTKNDAMIKGWGANQVQTVNVTGNLSLAGYGGAGTGNEAHIWTRSPSNVIGAATAFAPTSQTVNVGGNLVLNGSSTGKDNSVKIDSNGSQVVSVGGTLSLVAGNGGVGNSSNIIATGDQSVAAGNSIAITGGAGNGSYGNAAKIQHRSGGAGDQKVTLTGSNATLVLVAGSGNGGGIGVSAGHGGIPDACVGNTYCDRPTSANPMTTSNNSAYINNELGNQKIDFLYGGSISLTGGSNGVWNYAQIQNHIDGVQQTIYSSNGSVYYPSIAMTGGASGGALATYGGAPALDGTSPFKVPIFLRNAASIFSNATSKTPQLINASSITMTGGGDSTTYGGAWIEASYQNIVSNGVVELKGGAGASASMGLTSAFIGFPWGSPNIQLTAGSLSLQGGSGQNSAAFIGSREYPSSFGNIQINASGAFSSAANIGGVGIGGMNSQNPWITGAPAIGNIVIRDASVNAGSITLSAPSSEVNIQGAAAFTQVYSSGAMSLTGNNVNLVSFGSGVSVNAGTSQTVTATNSIRLQASNGTNFQGLYGGGVGLQSDGTQSLTAPNISVYGGTTGHDNSAWIQATGDQTITINGGVLTLMGGGDASTSVYGGAGSYNNNVSIEHGKWISQGNYSGSGSQTATMNSGGSIVVTAGSGTGVSGYYDSGCVAAGFSIAACSGGNNNAELRNGIGNQTVNFASGGTITLKGGGAGSGNGAGISSQGAGAQTISGASNIALYGGAAGGRFVGTAAGQDYSLSNDAGINAGTSSTQNISVGNIYISAGGAAEGGAGIGGDGATTVNASGNVTLVGGSVAPPAGTLHSPAFIGHELSGATTLNVGGTLSMTGNSSGAFIGNYRGATNTNVNVTGNIALVTGSIPGSVGIGSYQGYGGSVTVKSGGSLALADAKILTGSNGTSTIALTAAGALSQGTVGYIGTDTLTVTSSTGSVSLTGQNQATNVTANGATGVTYYSDAPTTHFSGGATGGNVLVQYDPLHTGGGSIGIGTINASGSVTVNARGAIIDDNAATAGTVNITAGSATLTSATGGAAGGLAISADTAVTGAITASVGTGSANGGIRIANYGGAPASVSLTDNAAAGGKASFFNSADITNTNNYTLKTLNGGDLALQSGGNLTYTGGSLATPSGSVLVGAGGTLNVSGTLSTPANVDLALAGATAVNVGGGVTTAGTGTIAITAPAVSVGGSLNSGDDVGVIATSLSLGSGSTVNAGHDVIFQGGDVTATSSKVTAAHDINFTLAGDLHLNNGSSLTAGNDIWLALNGGISTLYLNDAAAMAPSYLWAKAPSTIHLTYALRTSGGIVVDGVAANAADFSTKTGASGLFFGPLMSPAAPGSGLIVLGVSKAPLVTAEAIAAITNTTNSTVLATIASTTTSTSTTSTQSGNANFVPPLASAGAAGTSLTMLNTTQTIGGGEGTFGGGSSSGGAGATSSAGSSGSGTGSSSGSGGSGDKSAGDKSSDDKSASGKKDDKKDDDKKKDEDSGQKKQADKPAAKKLATCS